MEGATITFRWCHASLILRKHAKNVKACALKHIGAELDFFLYINGDIDVHRVSSGQERCRAKKAVALHPTFASEAGRTAIGCQDMPLNKGNKQRKVLRLREQIRSQGVDDGWALQPAR